MTSQEELRERVKDCVPDDVTLFERDGDVWGRDSHGEFKLDPMTGAAEPQDGRCNWPCRYTMERYGETRYCTRIPAGKFPGYDSDFCKTHISADSLMEYYKEDLFEHGYFATTYANFAKKLPPVKFLLAVEMVQGLFALSRHSFDIEETNVTIDTEESDLIIEDAVDVSLPMPSNESLSFQANELWMAALDEVKLQNMQEVVFETGMERETTTDTADVDGEITDTLTEMTEHHLHLPISRLTKDIKEHLKNGGIDIDEEGSSTVTFQKNDYTLDIEPGDLDEAEDMMDVGENFTEQLEAEEIEVN